MFGVVLLELADGGGVFLALFVPVLGFVVEFFLEGVEGVLGLVQFLGEGGDLGVALGEHVGEEVLFHAGGAVACHFIILLYLSIYRQ